MANVSCTRRIQFCAGHRLKDHEGKCANIHGHNYVALFTAVAGKLDDVGRVIDFAVLKERIGGWIEKYWDHGFIYNEADTRMFDALRCVLEKKSWPAPFNPTAEEMAKHLLQTVCPRLLKRSGVIVTKVELWETENCKATAELTEIDLMNL
jgi:6-pyruvoyltetrahydropterin/6-carboxytetrahydropterin synthase